MNTPEDAKVMSWWDYGYQVNLNIEYTDYRTNRMFKWLKQDHLNTGLFRQVTRLTILIWVYSGDPKSRRVGFSNGRPLSGFLMVPIGKVH